MPTTDNPTRPPQRARRLLLLAAVLVALATGCNLRSVGANSSGQLGDRSQVERTTPVAAGAVTFTSISAGSDHSCGIAEAGTLFCWGTNGSARAGLGDDVAFATEPTQVGTASDWTAVSAGSAHTCGIRGGLVHCWGSNLHGKTDPRSGAESVAAPTTPQELRSFVASSVSAGVDHTCATRNDGLLVCWGRNDDGRLGAGDTVATPAVRITGGGYRTVSAGHHTCAITTTGRLDCWGRNDRGQLGVGDLQARLVPQAVTQQPGWTSVDVGTRHTCGLAQDGSASCWGHGDQGQLGLGSTQDRLVPVRVAPGTRWIALATGSRHTCAVRTDGRPLCWGDNQDGSLGDGTEVDRLVPTPMAGDLDAIDVSAGGGHTHVILAPEE